MGGGYLQLWAIRMPTISRTRIPYASFSGLIPPLHHAAVWEMEEAAIATRSHESPAVHSMDFDPRGAV